MDYYVGIDVSLKDSSVCVVDANGRVIRQAKVPSEPEPLIAWFGELGLELARVGLEAGPLSQWLHSALCEAGFRGGAARDAACEGGIVGDDCED
jgi:hypothetical protein